MALRIEDYGFISDCKSSALVGRDGSIDWLCWPRFDSDACFAALLGEEKHGRWKIAPQDESARITRRYRPGTMILETTFETSGARATLIDFMPPHDHGQSHLVRIVRGEKGTVSFCTELAIRFGYGATVPWMTRLDAHTLRGIAGPDMVILRTQVRLRGENMQTVGDFDVRAGETATFVLSHAPSHLPPPDSIAAEPELEKTEHFWSEWVGRNKLGGPWKEAVSRSLITLKALTYAPTGGIVAAATTSLPECIGGERNRDYRFCWLRDSTLTLLALMNAGYYEEAGAWRDWLLRAVAGSPQQMQIMYGIAGERRLTEYNLPWLPGYENSKPVRIGNAAHNQVQLDVYGELMDTLHQARTGGISSVESGWDLQKEFLSHLNQVWQKRDEGVWEVRGGKEHFTYSKVMAWVAFDRSIKSAEAFGLAGAIEQWRAVRDRIHAEVCAKGFDAELGSFVRAFGSRELDASLLLLPAVGFLPPEDPRIRGTIAAIEKDLLVDGLVLRYDTQESDDGLPGGEGVFLASSFWLADAYLLLNRRDEAIALFERLLSLRNDLGLLSEEYDPHAKRMVGNFPQAFSHLALVNTASNLANEEKPAEQRSTKDSTGKPDRKLPTA
jgi:GH15 family glucan-1,4-alpha-glucosidase